MSYDDEKLKAGKRLVHVVEVELDYCELEYGATNSAGTCPAALGTDSDHKCHNTRATCPVPASYQPRPKTYRFIKPVGGVPRNIDAIPSLESVEMAPAKIDPGKSLGKRASVSVRFSDHPHHDRGIDKYVRERISGDAAADGSTYNPYQQGTFFGKLRARNPFYLGRYLHVYSGYIPWDHEAAPDQQPAWTEAEFFAHLQKRTYVQERWEGPDASGRFKIEAKDILKLADDDRAQAPKPSNGRLDAAISASASSATLRPVGIGDSEYPASGRAKIGDEIVDFSRSGDSLTLNTRGDLNTDADSHDENDAVQLVYQQEGTKPSAIVQDLLVSYAGIESAFIPYAEWENEDDNGIGRLYQGYVVEPTPVVQLVNELSQQAGFYIWWDDLDQEVKFRAVRQPDIVSAELSDDDAFLQGQIKQKEQPDKRKSQVWIFYGLISPIKDIDKGKSYRNVYVDIDADAESSDEYGRPSIEKIYARWISRFNRPAAEDLASRVLSRFRDAPRKLDFTLPAVRSELETGRVFNATTRLIQDPFGVPTATRCLVLSKEQTEKGQHRIEAEEFLYEPPPDLGVMRVVISTDTLDFNLRDAFDSIYPSVEDGDTVECELEDGVIVGSSDPNDPSFKVGDWPSGVSITIDASRGRIQGAGGRAGGGGDSDYYFGDNGGSGQDGGTALYTRYPITLAPNEVWGGGGGGGGGGGAGAHSDNYMITSSASGGGGGGGQGYNAGAGGPAGDADNSANSSASDDGDGGASGSSGNNGSGGGGGDHNPGGSTYLEETHGGNGGAGGAAGSSGSSGGNGSASGGSTYAGSGGSGGAAGAAVDGDSYITYDGTGDIQGAQIN